MRTSEKNQSHVVPEPTSAEVSPQKDVDGEQENRINIANGLPQGLLLDAGESLLQGSSLLGGQGGRGAGGQTAEPQVEHFPAGRLGCWERWTKNGVTIQLGPFPPSFRLFGSVLTSLEWGLRCTLDGRC